MFGKKNCPNCNMKIRVKDQADMICPYCDTPLNILLDGTLTYKNLHQASQPLSLSSTIIHAQTPDGDPSDSNAILNEETNSAYDTPTDGIPQYPAQANASPTGANLYTKPDQNAINRKQLLVMIQGLAVLLFVILGIGMFYRNVFLTYREIYTDTNEDSRLYPDLSSDQNEDDFEKFTPEDENNGYDDFQESGDYKDLHTNVLPDEPIVRTKPESDFMINFVMNVFNSDVDKVTPADYERITTFKIYKLEPHYYSENGSFMQQYAIDYTLDGQLHTLSITDWYENVPRPLEYEDLTLFANLEELELDFEYDVSFHAVAKGTLDLRSLTHLHTFVPLDDMTLQETIQTLAEPSQIRKLGFCLDTSDDLDELPTNFPNLEDLKLIAFHDSIGDFSSIGKLTSLKHLSTFLLEDNNYLENLTSLEHLELRSYSFDSDFRFLGKLHSIQKLSLSQLYFPSDPEIPFLENLSELDLNDVYIENFGNLNQFCSLKKLHIDALYVEGLPGIDELTSLEELYVYDIMGDYFEGMPTLESLTNLKKLWIPFHYYNAIGNLPGLTHLTIYPVYIPTRMTTGTTGIHSLLPTPNLEEFTVCGFLHLDTMDNIDQLTKLKTLTINGVTADYFSLDEYLHAPALERIRIFQSKGEIRLKDTSLRHENLIELSLNGSILYANGDEYESDEINDGFSREFFQTMPNLQILKMNDIHLDNIDFIQDLPHLEVLDISRNDLDDLHLVNEHPTIHTIYYSTSDSEPYPFREGIHGQLR